MRFIEKNHEGGVISRVVSNAIVEEPIVITVNGAKTELTLEDACGLAKGLLAAIKAVEIHQIPVLQQEHHMCVCKIKTGIFSSLFAHYSTKKSAPYLITATSKFYIRYRHQCKWHT